jgi:hypothetical protein
MNLYIETENGVVKNHPALEDNLLEAFGAIPENWEPFVRVEAPALNTYKVRELVYAKVDGVWSDVWSVRDMTTEEKTARQQSVINAFNSRDQAENWSAWVLDEATCSMQPPIPSPINTRANLEAGIYIFWCGAENGWKESPAKPVDNNQYKFDFLAWQWVQVVN